MEKGIIIAHFVQFICVVSRAGATLRPIRQPPGALTSEGLSFIQINCFGGCK